MIPQQFKFSIEGMHCASCVATIENKLRSMSGVLSASVNLGLEQAVITAQYNQVRSEELIQAIRKLGYFAQPLSLKVTSIEDSYVKEFKKYRWRFFLALPFTLFLLLAMLRKEDGFTVPFWLEGLLALPVYAIAGFPFLKGGAVSLFRLHPDMNTLIAIGATAAFFSGYFETAATLLTFLILGRLLEARAKKAASQSLQSLMQTLPRNAHLLLPSGELKETKPEDLKVGDWIIVKPGEEIPVDGVVLEGTSSVNEALVTGEPMPILKKEKDQVLAGSQNQEGVLKIGVKKELGEAFLTQIKKLTEQALANKAPVERLADKVSGIFVPIVLLMAFATFWGWWRLGMGGDWRSALSFAVAVLIIACPCALGLATPTAVIAGLGLAAKRGILFKGGDVLEKVRHLHTIVLDKTGTLTKGSPQVKEILITGKGFSEVEVLRFAAMVENVSEHLLAKAIVKEAGRRDLDLELVSDFKSYPGLGAKARLGDREILIGSSAFLVDNGIDLGPLANVVETKKAIGQTVIYVVVDQKLVGGIVLEDVLKENASRAIRALKEMELNIWMITGDQKVTALRVAKGLNMTKVLASLKPEEKAAAIAELKKEGLGVAMVGDGINDAPALAQADVGIAFASGSDLTKQASDITLLRGDPMLVVSSIRLAKKTYSVIRQNLWLSSIYNIVAIPIAAGVLYPFFGLKLSPEIAAIAMSLSSVSVILNSLRLRWA